METINTRAAAPSARSRAAHAVQSDLRTRLDRARVRAKQRAATALIDGDDAPKVHQQICGNFMNERIECIMRGN